MSEELNKILKQLYEHFNRDKKKLIKFCLERGHTRTDIAKAMGITLPGLSKFIKRNMETK